MFKLIATYRQEKIIEKPTKWVKMLYTRTIIFRELLESLKVIYKGIIASFPFQDYSSASLYILFW